LYTSLFRSRYKLSSDPVFFQFISYPAVIGQPGHLILTTEFSPGFHMITKCIFGQWGDPEWAENISDNEIFVVGILKNHLPVEFFGKFRWILRLGARCYKAFVVGAASSRN